MTNVCSHSNNESLEQGLNVSLSDFTRNFPFKEIRPKQLEVLEQIANAINTGFRYIVLEAPTGFGKSPVAIAVGRTLGSSYMCSATKDLQTQYTNDFPFLRSIKGMGNFDCLVKEDFILNKSYACGPCKVDQRQNTFYGHNKECRHITAAYGPCRDKNTAFAHIPKECNACSSLKEYEEGDGEIDFHNGCRYRTYPEDYEVIFANTDKEDVVMDSIVISEYQKYSTERGGMDGWMHLENIDPTTNLRLAFTPCEYYDQLNKGKLASHTIFNYANFLIFVRSKKIGTRKLLVLDEGHQIENQVVEDIGITISKKTLQKYIDASLLENTEFTYDDDLATTWLQLLCSLYDELEKSISTMVSREIRIDAEQYLNRLGDTLAAIKEDTDNWIVSEIVYDNNSHNRDGKSNKQNVSRVTFKPVDVAPYCVDLFNQCDLILIMSATILDFNTFCRNVGLEKDKVKFIEVGSDFPIKNRPIYQMNTAHLNFTSLQLDSVQTKLAETIDNIMSNHANDKGIIHTTSYAQVRFIEKLLSIKNRNRLISTDPEIPREEIVAKHLNSPTSINNSESKKFVLISPSLHTGLDLKDEQSRFQIVVKIPYPSKGDRWIAKKLQLDGGKWYNWQTALRLVQACGRSIRSKDDWAKTYVLDSAFSRFIRENKLPVWFKEAIV